MSKAVRANQGEKVSDPIGGLLAGVAAILLAIKKSDPELDSAVTRSSQSCRDALSQREYKSAGNELKTLAQTLHQRWSAKTRAMRQQYGVIATTLAALDKEHYTDAQRKNVSALIDGLTTEHIEPELLPQALAKAYVDMSETLSAYRQKPTVSRRSPMETIEKG